VPVVGAGAAEVEAEAAAWVSVGAATTVDSSAAAGCSGIGADPRLEGQLAVLLPSFPKQTHGQLLIAY
jgi:hypothetical protein